MGRRKKIIKTKIYQFIALSDGNKRTYYNEDGLEDYPSNIIRDPRKMSFTNLYINGVLQPLNHYRIRRGVLRLTTMDVPPKGAPIMLQFTKLYLGSGRKKTFKKRTPSFYEAEEEE